jgi:hypothetical protein
LEFKKKKVYDDGHQVMAEAQKLTKGMFYKNQTQYFLKNILKYNISRLK